MIRDLPFTFLALAFAAAFLCSVVAELRLSGAF
jgi:hypothetical protein